MTRTTNARIAGFTYLFYAAVGLSVEALMHRATNAVGDAAIVARIAEHATDVRITILLTLLESFSALVLAVTLYGITRDHDHELAMLALVCRVAEGVIGSIAIQRYSGLLWLANAQAGGNASDLATMNAVRTVVMMPRSNVPIGTIFFAAGSAIFSYLMLRGRIVPVSLASFGVFAYALLLVSLPLQLAGFSTGPLTGYSQWLPALVFQIVLALWLLIKGVAPAATR